VGQAVCYREEEGQKAREKRNVLWLQQRQSGRGGSRASDTGGQVVVVCGGGLADGRPAVVVQNSLYQQLLELVVGRAAPA